MPSEEVEAIQTSIAESAADGIASAAADGVTTTVMSIDERIKAANYLAAQNAAGKNHFGLRFTKLVPPGGG